MSNHYISAGELAGMLGINKQTVLYYDRIGMLVPAHRDENGVRGYLPEQADELDAILTFRSLNVPLDQIRTYLSAKSPENCISMLASQLDVIERQVRELVGNREKIRSRLTYLREALEAEQNPDHVRLIHEPRTVFAYVACRETDRRGRIEASTAVWQLAKEMDVDFQNPVSNRISEEKIRDGRYTETSGFGIPIPEERIGDAEHIMVKEEGDYAVGYHVGPYEDLPKSYRKMLDYLDAHGYTVCGDAWETDLLSTMTSADHDRYMKRLSVLVSRRAGE